MSNLEVVTINPARPPQASIIWLHGLGADGHDFVPIVENLALPVELAARFIFPHAPVRPVTINAGMAMRAWFDLYGLTPDAPQDELGIRKAQAQIEKLIEHEHQAGIPHHRIVLAGFSQGGALALYTGLRFAKPLAGILGLSTFLPLHEHLTAEIKSPQVPISLAHGTFDAVVPLMLGELTCRRLQNLGCNVEWHTYPMQHEVCLAEIMDIRGWLLQVLK